MFYRQILFKYSLPLEGDLSINREKRFLFIFIIKHFPRHLAHNATHPRRTMSTPPAKRKASTAAGAGSSGAAGGASAGAAGGGSAATNGRGK